jgi:anti-sigma factor ChrR (cupin superfamily)
MFFQNNSTGDIWLSTVGTAAATQPSLWLPPGAYVEYLTTQMTPNAAVSIFGATTGQSFTAREW